MLSNLNSVTAIVALSCIAIVGCDRTPSAAEDSTPPQISDASVSENPNPTVPLAAVLNLTTDEPAQVTLRIDDGHVVCGIAARLVKAKGHEFLFRAAAQLHEQYPALRLLLLGEGVLEQDLRALAEKLDALTQGHHRPFAPLHGLGAVPHQSPGRVAAPGFIKQRPAVMARGCGRLLAHACASLLKFLRRSLYKRPRRGSACSAHHQALMPLT